MATRKKKPENVPSEGWPIINQGTHLTVKTFEDGSTELIWDDEALLNEVIDAISQYESVTPDMKPSVKAKVAVQKKKAKAKADE